MELESVLHGHFTLSTQIHAPCESANSRRFVATVLYEAVKIELPEKGTILKYKNSLIGKGSFYRLR